MEYSVHEAKTHFSKLLQQAQAGETVVITSGRDKKPIVRLVPVAASRIGSMAGMLDGVGEKLLEPMSEEENAQWYDGPIFPPEP
jgi:prevent-host-death family protein